MKKDKKQTQLSEQAITDLVTQISAGDLTEQQYGMISKKLQLNMAYSLIAGSGALLDSIAKLNTVKDKLMDKYVEALDIESVNYDAETCADYLAKINTQQIQALDLHRKIVQGKDLIPQDTLSEEENKVLRLMNSFASTQEKEEFLQLVEDTLAAKQYSDNTFAKPKSDEEIVEDVIAPKEPSDMDKLRETREFPNKIDDWEEAF